MGADPLKLSWGPGTRLGWLHTGQAKVPRPGGLWAPRADRMSAVHSTHGTEHPAELHAPARVLMGAQVGKSFSVSGSLQATNTALKTWSYGSEHVQTHR